MRIDLITLFPEMLDGFWQTSILSRARRNGYVQYQAHNLRYWSQNKHGKVDDRPFGGGAGMLLQPEPVARAIQELRQSTSLVIYPCPDGELLTTEKVRALAQCSHLILLSGHYEGLDQRIREQYIDLELSIGDYVLTNGTLASAVIMDAICRYIPGVLGNDTSLSQDSFSDGLLTFPQYTQPRTFEGMDVPEILLSGNHQAIEQWRQQQRIAKTKQRRPDLWEKYLQKHQIS